MTQKAKAMTCIDCGAWEIVTTDWMTSRLIVEASKPCTCTGEAGVNQNLTGKCEDCGSPCDWHGKRCVPCGAIHNRKLVNNRKREVWRDRRAEERRARREARGMPSCPCCGTMLAHHLARWCPEAKRRLHGMGADDRKRTIAELRARGLALQKVG